MGLQTFAEFLGKASKSGIHLLLALSTFGRENIVVSMHKPTFVKVFSGVATLGSGECIILYLSCNT